MKLRKRVRRRQRNAEQNNLVPHFDLAPTHSYVEFPTRIDKSNLTPANILRLQRLQGNKYVRHILRSEASTSITEKVMREPDTLSLESEVTDIRKRIAEISGSGTSTLEEGKLRDMLAWREALAAETDPIRREIIKLKGALTDLRYEMKAAPPDSSRELIGIKIRNTQIKLASALRKNIVRLEKRIKEYYKGLSLLSDPMMEKELMVAEKEYIDTSKELEKLEVVFSPAKAEAMARKYKKEVRPIPGGGCMTAVYKGMEALFSPEEATELKKKVHAEAKTKTNNINLIMETLRSEGKAGAKTEIKYNKKKKGWEPDLEATVLSMVYSEYLGWYFFGLSLHGAYHSVILAVDNSQGGAPQIYWLDQYSKGFTKNVTGKLEKQIKKAWLRPGYGYAPTKLWPIIPSPEKVIEIE